MEVISLRNINKIYGKGDAEVKAIKDVSISINEGELVAIVGTSGSGKSTLLNIIGCIDRPTSGEYLLSSQEVQSLSEKNLAKKRNKSIGFVLQYFGLINSYTVYENVELPLIYSKTGKAERTKKVEEILSRLNILDKKNKYPSELSGGQNQRVAIARALVNDPQIILADEPTGALDKNTSREVMEILTELNKTGKTVILVTHDEKISSQCERVLRIEDGSLKEEN